MQPFLPSRVSALRAQIMGIVLPRLPGSLIPAILTFFLLSTSLVSQAQENHTTFIFNKFNRTDLLLINDSLITSNVLHLTRSDKMLGLGRALYPIPVQVTKPGPMNTTVLMSFSTTFVFSVVPRHRAGCGHGLAFIMTPYKSIMGALAGQYLGLFNLTSNGQSYNHLFAVEFDTIMNPELEDMDNNHVGVDLNSLISSKANTAGYWVGKQFHPLKIASAENIQAWIDYDHLQNQLNISVTLAGFRKPIQPLISVKNIDLAGIFQERMYVGFSAATGALVEDHNILAWSFNTKGMAPALDLTHLPSFLSKKSMYQSTGFKAGITVASVLLFWVSFLAVALWVKRRRDREVIEDWELEYWPHRFSYKELSIATNRFREKELLGSGGFGRVYKGVIPGSGLQVAVKCLNKEVTQGMKEFIAEISSMGRLQHRNLVRLRGWCRRKNRLFIVYDYMANGSLDRMIFGKSEPVLKWPQRYTILKGVAAGLFYLHEEWEKRVVHRDIKSSNVLLDSELNARLGDFGLARIYDHTQNPQTTHVVGTLGYIAPELIHTGKATPSSDVFSFGIVLLEVACGRRPVEPSKGAEQTILLDWVCELPAKDRLMDAVDPKLGGEYDPEEMERVLHLGLFCCHPEPQARLTVEHALQILEGEIPLQVLRGLPIFKICHET